MGQTQSTAVHAEKASIAQSPLQRATLEPLRHQQLEQLTAQLSRYCDALAVMQASKSSEDTPNDGASHTFSSSSSTSSSSSLAARLLQPFAALQLQGYQLGDDCLTVPIACAALTAPASVLSLLSHNTALTVLDLGYNALSPAIVGPLLDALRDLPALTVLRLSGNPLGSHITATVDATPLSGKAQRQLPVRHHGSPADAVDGEAANSVVLDGTPYASDTEAPSTAAAQLGRWLSSDPPLEELAMYQCGLSDADVRDLLRGLLPPPSPLTATGGEGGRCGSRLEVLQLAGNPACTWRSARMALDLVTTHRNTSLCVVELEGAAVGVEARMEARMEYACTPDGHFRSGETQLPSPTAENASATEAAKERLTPGQAARFHGRCRHLAVDLDGTRVLPPALMQELRAALASRHRHSPPAACAKQSQEDAGEPTSPSALAGETTLTDPSKLCLQQSIPAATEAASEALEATPVRPHTQPSAASAQTSTPRRALTAPSLPSHSARTHSRRAARLESPRRIAHVMAEAAAFRRHIHPLQVDTRAPACAEVHARSTSSQYGSERSAATWYAHEGFVLRSNGLSSVLVAPVLTGSVSCRHNVLMDDVEDRPLQACWCTPQNSTSAASYAGTLHYHCVREGDPVKHQGGLAALTAGRGASKRASKKASGRGHQPSAASTTAAPFTAGGKALLPPLASGNTSVADRQRAMSRASGKRSSSVNMTTATSAAGGEEKSGAGGRPYQACCGTGHTCLSSSVTDCGSLRSQRLRTTLLSMSVKKPTQASPAAREERLADLLSLSTTTASAAYHKTNNSSSSNNNNGSCVSAAPPVTMFGGAKTVHTLGNGLAVALNYSPVAYFTAPHVPCAAGIAVEECS